MASPFAALYAREKKNSQMGGWGGNDRNAQYIPLFFSKHSFRGQVIYILHNIIFPGNSGKNANQEKIMNRKEKKNPFVWGKIIDNWFLGKHN